VKEEDNEQYRKRGPLAVLGVLKDLVKNQTPVRVTHQRGQFITRLLCADRERFIVDYGSNDYDNQLAAEARLLNMTAETAGAKVEFAVSQLRITSHTGLPAFTSGLPDDLIMIQRREFFRVTAPLSPLFTCYVGWPDGSGQGRLRLQDISLGGISVLAECALPPLLAEGDLFKNMRLEMGEYGRFEVDARLVNIGQRSVIGSKNQTLITPRLSFRFQKLSADQERQLQQVIFSLERLARDKATRFQ